MYTVPDSDKKFAGVVSESKLQALRGPADPLLDPGPWTLDLETLTLMPSWEDLRATWVRSGAILGQPRVILGLSWEDLEATWVHLGPSWGYLGRTW